MVDIWGPDVYGNAMDGTLGALAASVGGIGTITNVVPGDTTNTITFTTVENATSYNLYWATSPSVTVSSNQIIGVTSPYIHTGRTNGTTYYYRYSAIVGGQETALSNELSGTPAVPAPPFLVFTCLRA